MDRRDTLATTAKASDAAAPRLAYRPRPDEIRQRSGKPGRRFVARGDLADEQWAVLESLSPRNKKVRSTADMDQEAADQRHTLPGGTIKPDDGETPHQGTRRETVEEIGLDREPGRLLAVDQVYGVGQPPLVAHLYDGGVSDFAAIHLLKNGHRAGRLAGRARSLRGVSVRQPPFGGSGNRSHE
ncbi:MULTISPECIES: NUDIX domain-containing protein [Streptomyces]|uniref:NUDIX domain-containing protein n=1 Tax=Streptomyces kaempferi TaxID=333725 RepID=A0ABW3XI83_9ACTN|nr:MULTISPECIES: NUDIX domain-containing protein [unclassified Streptomyces]